MKNRPTAEQAREFDEHVAKWQRVLNLCDWRIERSARPAPKGAMAAVYCNDSARLATTFLGDFAGEAITGESLDRTALHECLHVFLRDLIVADKSNETAMEGIEHRVINVLERLIYGNAESK